MTVWRWFEVGDLVTSVSFSLDALSLVMILVVTTVGFLIHVYSARFMAGEEGYSRFFAYMNLFVASMLILVLADNFVLLYLGWEGVGLCSYLLIGFWYTDPANGRAARKAFIVTRIGDVALAIGLFLIWNELGSLDIQEVARRAATTWAAGSAVATWAAALLLGGAVGKSAQLPLQTWLPDAMAGPTPVSALIHAATMVTAGVYLIARSNALFLLAPGVMMATAIIGAAGLLVAGLSATTQTDIKRVLAYSTMSQLGYMFLALGVGAWSAAIFHLLTHALFKSLLFLSAGVVILAMDHEHNISVMGGLARKLPFTFVVFLVGAFALTSLPPVTAGFSSKDMILALTYEAPGGRALWAIAEAGVLVTSFYTFRLVFLVFLGKPRAALTEPRLRATTGIRRGASRVRSWGRRWRSSPSSAWSPASSTCRGRSAAPRTSRASCTTPCRPRRRRSRRSRRRRCSRRCPRPRRCSARSPPGSPCAGGSAARRPGRSAASSGRGTASCSRGGVSTRSMTACS